MDIRFGTPDGALSNLTPRFFVFRGVPCASMEGLLQSFKFAEPHVQKVICTLSGHEARRAGFETDWRPKQMLYWMGGLYPRDSIEYQHLLEEGYTSLFTQNEDAAQALKDTGDRPLCHSVGRSNPKETILTEREFIKYLTKMRNILLAEKYVEF